MGVNFRDVICARRYYLNIQRYNYYHLGSKLTNDQMTKFSKKCTKSCSFVGLQILLSNDIIFILQFHPLLLLMLQ